MLEAQQENKRLAPIIACITSADTNPMFALRNHIHQARSLEISFFFGGGGHLLKTLTFWEKYLFLLFIFGKNTYFTKISGGGGG